jgi:hypothetical protein
MIKIPAEFSNPLFDQNLKRGSIIRTLLTCHDGSQRPHYFITLSKLIERDPLVFVIATSKVGFYDRNPHFNTDIIRLAAKTLSCFPVDTVIDCRKIEKVPKEKLKQHFNDNSLEFIGDLPMDYMTEIDTIVRRSRHIPLNDKLLILGDPPASQG